MTREAAEEFLKGHTLSLGEHEQAMLLVGKSLVIPRQPKLIPTHDVSRRRWLLAAWLAGASWRQLAFLHQIAPQTILSSVDRMMPSVVRQEKRLRKTMSLENLTACRQRYLDNEERYDGMEPEAIAEDLLAAIE